MATTHLRLTGMSCAACAQRIEQTLQDVAGVETATVNFALEQATNNPGAASNHNRKGVVG